MATNDTPVSVDGSGSNLGSVPAQTQPVTTAAKNLETLSAELVLRIADNLDNADKNRLALVSKTTAHRLGGAKLLEQASQKALITQQAHDLIAEELEKRISYNPNGPTFHFMDPALLARGFASVASRNRFDNALLASRDDVERMRSIGVLTSSPDLEDAGRRRYVEHCFTQLRTHAEYGHAEILAACAIKMSDKLEKLTEEQSKEFSVIFTNRYKIDRNQKFAAEVEGVFRIQRNRVPFPAVDGMLDVPKAVTTLSDLRATAPKNAAMAEQRLSDLDDLARVSRADLFAERNDSGRDR